MIPLRKLWELVEHALEIPHPRDERIRDLWTLGHRLSAGEYLGRGPLLFVHRHFLPALQVAKQTP